MSRLGDIAIGIIIGVGGLIGAALAFDKYGNSSATKNAVDTEGGNDTVDKNREELEEEHKYFAEDRTESPTEDSVENCVNRKNEQSINSSEVLIPN